MGAEEAEEYFLSEIFDGLEETRESGEPVFPGFIKIAVQASLDDSPQHLMEAAAAASRVTGYLIEMHTEKGQDIERILEFMGRADLEPGRLVICHIDKRPDIGLHRELAQEGYALEYDTFFRPKYQPVEHLWPLIEEMAAGGYAGSLVLATDLADKSLWAFGGGIGIEAYISTVYERLVQTGFTPEDIRAMMGGNIAQRLAIPIKEE
jgi:phosphotriesterase-related protein